MADWDLYIYLMFTMLMILAVFLIKSNGSLAWSLKRRAYFRKEMAEQLKKYGKLLFPAGEWGRTPIGFFKRLIQTFKMQKYEKEIFEAVTFLRNMAVIGKGKTTSTDYVLEMLAEHRGLLQPVYLQMLSYLRVNQKSEAIEFFARRVSSKISRDFAWFLIQWDEINPQDLSENLFSFEKRMKEIRLTTQKHRDEIISDLIYFPVVLNIFVIFINFIYVAYFLDQKEMLQLFLP
ncbi:hypothetical protein [Sinanaerobacter chloroacetimidivorans]|uniref:Uncharacterized protein n=1 Tax=Sinanaerobacter chloroacetimidivorans TaxID=2818044 RepID=A0A8J8B0I4_9FIRM|nr:hypothetical protein [Sinanaerobacter chloroacetimidivorans]MBR0596827.1 hypothetical protein [Sinanaerobacter chloroacetimidivorans]